MKGIRQDAAFWAAVSLIVCLIFGLGGCGGGGGGGPEPQIPIFIEGWVEDEVGDKLANAVVNVPEKPTIQPFRTAEDGRFQLNVTGQTGLLTINVHHDDVGSMQQLVNLADAQKVGNRLVLDITSPFVIKRNIREVHLEEAYIRVAGATLLEYDGADERKPMTISRDQIIDGPQNLVVGYQYQLGDPRVTLDPEYVSYWYLYPSDEGRVIVSAVFRGPKPDNTRVFVTLDLVRPTDGIAPTVTVDAIASKVSGTLIIKGTASDGEDRELKSEIPIINLSEIVAGRALNGRDYNGHHIEGPPSGVQSVTLRYSGQDQSIEPSDNGSFEFAVDTTKLPDGPITFELSATDNAGNSSEVISTKTVVDNRDPWEAMPTINRQLVAVNEDPRKFGPDTWPNERGYGLPRSIAFKSDPEGKGPMLVYAGYILEYLFGSNVPRRYTKELVWGDGDSLAINRQNDELYACNLQSNRVWWFDSEGYLIKTVNIHRGIQGPELVEVDRSGYVWIQFSGYGSGFGCYNSDLTPVMAVDIPDAGLGFAADKAFDTLIWYRDIEGGATQFIRRRTSTGEDIILYTFMPGIGIGDIELDTENGQVLIDAGLDNKSYLIQLSKGADGQWSELHRTKLVDPPDGYMDRIAPGANKNEVYVYSIGGMVAQRFRYQ